MVTGNTKFCATIVSPLVKKLCPEVEKTLQWLLKYAPSKMTGTGSCCFVEFASQTDAHFMFLKIFPSDWNGFIASSVNISPAHTQLNAIHLSNASNVQVKYNLS